MKRCKVPLGLVLCLIVLAGSDPARTAEERAAQEAGAELVELVVNLLREGDKDLRALGFDQVRSQAQGDAATRRFAAELPVLSPEAQVGLLGALADRGDKAARGAVLALLETGPEEPVQAAAVEALGTLGEPDDVQLLIERLKDGRKAAQQAARNSLIRLAGNRVPQAIADVLERSPPALRVTLIEILAARRAAAVAADILPAAVDPDPSVRAAAMAALGQLAGPDELRGMLQGVLAAQSGDEQAAAEKCLLLVCQRLEGEQDPSAVLLAAIETFGTSDRLSLLPALGRVGGPAALTAMETALADPNPQIHAAGLSGLCHWPDASVADRLIELAHADEHPQHRIMALRALIRIAPLRDDRRDSERLRLLQQAMAMCTRDADRNLVLERAQAVRTIETLRFVTPYMDQPAHASQACRTVVELAHHRGLREPNKTEFDRALDKVIESGLDATLVERAQRYKKGQTWVRTAERK